ncbi:yqaJ domain-containing protein [Trichonephila clavata]|uniref:YqaJ domain-containing protein n=1 Tax=Trichonephila clavata TaxID=2740835 RepID=A0A8X6KB65_TRICU|nr:yqaJ domain-containing protein [Trichonephila clavata]
MGVRNRYCMVCSRAAAANEQAGRHCCSKNWHGSSSSMEANIIQEGFMNSVAMYGIKYTKIIGDGDSNVYKTILDSRPYDALQKKRKRHIEAKRKTSRRRCRKSLFLDKKIQQNYGVSAQKPDLSESIPPPPKEWLLSTLRLSDEEMKGIERKTINQRTSPLWKEERRKRLTASDFGAICKNFPTRVVKE